MTALSGPRIRDFLARGELMRTGTWDPDRIHNARYDLRIASDMLMIPDQVSATRSIRKYGDHGAPSAYTGSTFDLLEGETAFLTTVEEFAMPLDVAAILALRPRYARDGLILLSGQIVDPGYGTLPGGTAAGGDCDRLFFAVGNLGSRGITLACGEPILSILFLRVDGVDPAASQPVTRGAQILRSTILDETFQNTSLSLVTALKESQDDLEALKAGVERWSNERDQRDALMYLAISLIAGTVLSVALATLFSLITGNETINEVSEGAGYAIGGIAIASGLVAVIPFLIALRRKAR